MIQNAKVISVNTPSETYHATDVKRGSPLFPVSAHVLCEVLRNAQRWVRGYVSPDSAAKKWGSMLDCYLLTPKFFSARYSVLPDDAPRRPSQRQIDAKKPSPETVEAIRWWREWNETHPGEVVSAELAQGVEEAAVRLKADQANAELLQCSQKQVWIAAEWEDKPTGLTVPLKCLIDLVPDYSHPVYGNALFDLKTTRNASPRQFRREAMQYRYDVQAAFYLDMWHAAKHEGRNDFGHIVQENFAPYEFRTPPPLVSQRFLNFGMLSYQAALTIYCRALQTGIWPSYDAQGGDWPITDCEDWFLSMETLYPTQPETDEAPEEEEEVVDIVP